MFDTYTSLKLFEYCVFLFLEVFQRENVSLKMTLGKENVCFEFPYDNFPTRPLLYRLSVVNSKHTAVYIQSCKKY